MWAQITNNEPQFTGHFPERPIMPGVLMIEAMAQLGGIVCLQEPVSDGKGLFFFAGELHSCSGRSLCRSSRGACCRDAGDIARVGFSIRPHIDGS